MVGPKIGKDLQKQAILATLYALGGMLVYIAFRFEWIYGVAAVIAVFHDTIITIGLFSLFNKEISLTVVAALLTLVGYSMNDTIVVFDRIRENLKLVRRESLDESDQHQREPDLEPDGADQRSDIPDGAVAVLVRRPGAEQLLFRSGGRNYCGNVLVDFHCESNPGILAELPGFARIEGSGASGQAGKRSSAADSGESQGSARIRDTDKAISGGVERNEFYGNV